MNKWPPLLRKFVLLVGGLFICLCLLCILVISMIAGLGAFGLPGDNGTWLILTIPLGFLGASICMGVFVLFAEKWMDSFF